MDPALIVIMAFFLVCLILIGGFVLLMPLSKQLAKLVELRIQERSGTRDVGGTELRELRTAIDSMERQLRSMADRQEFLENILAAREQDLPRIKP